MDWLSSESELLINPRSPAKKKEQAAAILKVFAHLPAHIWIASSGSTGQQKWTALSKKAFLASAQAVNQHLDITSADRWINPLPKFHVGGLAIDARAFISGSRTLDCDWNPIAFCAEAQAFQATLTSLVPAHVYDLVSQKLKAPSSLRAVIVGGGTLLPKICEQALELGWPILPSYGMTETASQIATANRVSPNSKIKILPHMRLRTDSQNFLSIQSESLLTGYAIESATQWLWHDPKEAGWLKTEDRVEISEGTLKFLGRNQHFIKIGGESVDLLKLEHLFENLLIEHHLFNQGILWVTQDDRLGHVIQAILPMRNDRLIEAFNAKVLPFERIRDIHYMVSIPRTPLGKVDRLEIEKLLREGTGCDTKFSYS